MNRKGSPDSLGAQGDFVMRIRTALALGGLIALLPAGCVNPGAASRSNSPIPPLPETPHMEKAAGDLSASESAKICLTTAEQLEAADKPADAIPLYEKVRQLDPRTDAKVTRALANLYSRIGEFDRAKDEFDRALRANPKSAEVLNDLGYCYYSRGMWKEAETVLRNAIAADAKHARAWTNLGMALGQQARYEEAVDAFRHVVSPGKAFCNIAFLMAAQGQRERAAATYREALKIEPDLQLARTALDRLEGGAPPSSAAAPTGDAGGTPTGPISTARRNP
jgi:Tfp pilus assembly protein PilF